MLIPLQATPLQYRTEHFPVQSVNRALLLFTNQPQLLRRQAQKSQAHSRARLSQLSSALRTLYQEHTRLRTALLYLSQALPQSALVPTTTTATQSLSTSQLQMLQVRPRAMFISIKRPSTQAQAFMYSSTRLRKPLGRVRSARTFTTRLHTLLRM